MPKSWIYEPTITYYEALLLYNALQKHQDDYRYHPVALAKREEVGTKYRFLCIATPESNPLLSSHFADIEVYKPINGMPYITSLFRLDFDNMFPQRHR